jgi:hypothetical protein
MYKTHLLALALAAGVTLPGIASASIVYTGLGTFSTADDLVVIPVVINSESDIFAESLAYGGGELGSGPGTPIAAGGFASVLATFDPTGALIAEDATGGSLPNCGGRGIDSSVNLCLDAMIYDSNQAPLVVFTPGTYHVVLSQQNLVPDGSTPLDPLNAAGSYAGAGDPDFKDPFGNTRTANWAVQIDVSSVPEPGGAALSVTGLLFIFIAGLARTHRRRRSLAL